MSAFLKHKGIIFNISYHYLNTFKGKDRSNPPIESYLKVKIINEKQDKVVKDTWDLLYNKAGQTLMKKDYAEPNSIAIIDGKYYNIISSFFNATSQEPNEVNYEVVLNFDYVELIENIEFSPEEENEMRSLGGISKYSL